LIATASFLRAEAPDEMRAEDRKSSACDGRIAHAQALHMTYAMTCMLIRMQTNIKLIYRFDRPLPDGRPQLHLTPVKLVDRPGRTDPAPPPSRGAGISQRWNGRYRAMTLGWSMTGTADSRRPQSCRNPSSTLVTCDEGTFAGG